MPAAADQTVVYVYGVARAPHERESIPLPLQGIVPEAPVERLADADLTAFISLVPARLFGAEEFRAALNDAKWLRARVVAHEKVLERLRSRYDVIPFRFGSVYLDASEVSNALSGHRTELGRALDRVRGASEWGLKVYCDGEVLRGALEAGSKSIRRMRDALAAASPGAQFFSARNTRPRSTPRRRRQSQPASNAFTGASPAEPARRWRSRCSRRRCTAGPPTWC